MLNMFIGKDAQVDAWTQKRLLLILFAIFEVMQTPASRL